jgi:hypothetical protein
MFHLGNLGINGNISLPAFRVNGNEYKSGETLIFDPVRFWKTPRTEDCRRAVLANNDQTTATFILVNLQPDYCSSARLEVI